jgi:hypothetical protein
MMRLTSVALALLAAGVGVAFGGPRDVNYVSNPGFEEVAEDKAAGWDLYGEGYELLVGEGREGGNCLKCTSTDQQAVYGAKQVIILDPPVKHPFVVSAWSKCEGAQGVDYSFWLDVHYNDGTPLWGQRAAFDQGTHDWQYAEAIFEPAKPVAEIEAFVLFRRMTGAACFDDLQVSLAPFEFGKVRVLGGLSGGGCIDAFASVTMPAKWQIEILRGGRTVFAQEGQGPWQRVSWDGTDGQGNRLPAGNYALRLSAVDDLLGERIETSREVNTMGAGAAGRYGLWTESSMKRVMPRDLPESLPQAPKLSLSAARNEYESGQIVLLPAAGGPLNNVRIEPGELTGPGQARISAENVQWHQVGYVWVEQQWPHPGVEQYAPCWWPDPLLPVESFDVEPAWAQPIWVTVYVPPGTAAGTYTGSVTIRPEGTEQRTVPLELEVHDFTIPVEGHLKTAFALMQGYLEKIYGKENVTRELRWKYGDFVLAHRLNPDDISRTEPPEIEDVAHYYDRGLNAFNVLNLVEARGERTWVCWSPLEVYTPEFRQSLIERLDPYIAELKRRGFADKAYVYTFDERGEEFFPTIREYFGLVRERWGIPTLTTAKVPQDPEVMRDLNVDWNCPVSPRYSFEEAERCRAQGLQVWSYVCCGPRHPYVNFLADDPLVEARLIWWQAFHQKMDGFLYWGLNIWGRQNNDAPIDLAEGPRLKWSITTGGERWAALHGDGVLLYPLPDGPMGSIRLANIRDGLEDYEYLWALGEGQGDVWSAREDCEPVTRSLTEFTLEPDVLLSRRDAIARRLVD